MSLTFTRWFIVIPAVEPSVVSTYSVVDNVFPVTVSETLNNVELKMKL